MLAPQLICPAEQYTDYIKTSMPAATTATRLIRGTAPVAFSAGSPAVTTTEGDVVAGRVVDGPDVVTGEFEEVTGRMLVLMPGPVV